jgi:hypothetical protein
MGSFSHKIRVARNVLIVTFIPYTVFQTVHNLFVILIGVGLLAEIK